MTSVGRIQQTVSVPELRSQIVVAFALQSVGMHESGLRSYGNELRPRSGLQ